MGGDVWGAVALVVVGAAAGAVPTFLVERAKWRREVAHAWVEARRAVYARYLSALSRATFEATMMSRRLEGFRTPELAEIPLGAERGIYPFDPAYMPEGPLRDTMLEVEQMRDLLAEVVEEIRLVAGSAVGDGAERCRKLVDQLVRAARDCLGPHSPSFVEGRAALTAQERELRAAMRQDIGVPP